MAELLAIGQDLKNLTVVDTLNSDGSANLRLAGNARYKPELRLTTIEVAALVKAWSTKTAPPASSSPSKVIVGVNGSVGWGPEDAKLLVKAGFKAARLEAGTNETIQAAVEAGFDPALCSVIVGNVNDSSPLANINVSSWTASTIAQIKELHSLGVSRFECGNEMYAKGGIYNAKAYAAMLMSLYAAIDGVGFPIKLGVSCINDTPTGKAANGGGWLRELIAAQPRLASRADYWITHPYPAESGKITDTGWMGNCGPAAVQTQVSIARSLGVKNNVWCLTEFGVQAIGPNYATGSLEHQANMCREYMTAFLNIPEVNSIYYFSVHDTGEGSFGLVTTPTPAGPLPWIPRPILSIFASFA